MLSVKAIYDGKKVKLLEKVSFTEPKEVIVTFLDKDLSDLDNESIYRLVEKGGSFDFLKEPEEDIYSDDNLKIKYK